MSEEEKKTKKFLEGKEVDEAQLQAARNNLKENQKLIEVSPNNFKILERLRG